ncbi:APH-domain-containing protein [Choiromyces venosus 120613-1]|uniref:APH-domain-containing protein n=1 Tax=Choiromyces venosus 120613-1 TaxID=1336337 RepID=A0A3N4JXC4_9PEZI|nr:APH-domain-containing protein [Choiromyces venosus 120613-1]
MAGPIRHPIPLDSLTDYLRNNVPKIDLPLTIQQFGYGQSNPTYLLTSTSTGAKYVLRKKPPGKLLSKTAHQVEREYKVLKALSEAAQDLPVPKVYCLCEDAEVVGSAFYIMEFLDGRIFEDPALPGVTPVERMAMWRSAILTLARLHKIRPEEHAALKSFGKPSGFYWRQIRTLSAIEAAQAATKDVETGVEVGKIPRFDEAMKFFSTTQPKDRSAVIHGDYKIDNLVFHKTKPRVIGVLDWELSTIGHPLSDVSNLLSPYQLALDTDASVMAGESKGFLPGATAGLPSRQQAIEWYGQASGWNVLPSEMYWGDAFGFCRNSVIAQGITARVARRQASSAKAGMYGERTPSLVALAWRYAFIHLSLPNACVLD